MTRATYWDYIRVEELLALQGGLDHDESHVSNDEAVFIVSHQVFELWFKIILRELTSARDLFRLEPVPDQRLASAVRALRRVVLLFRHAVSHFEFVETLTTRDFLAFRDRLIPASGFQSAQLREIEILLGLSEADRVPLGAPGGYLEALRSPDGGMSVAYRRVTARLADRPSLREVLDEWLYRTPLDGSTAGAPGDDEATESFVNAYLAAFDAEAEARRGRAATEFGGAAEAERVAARYAAEVENARKFMHGADETGIDPAQARRLSRIRAALIFIESYRELPLLAWPREVVDTVVEVEQAFVIFRQRHARMVERVIGRRTGTGGSAGVDYLDKTALNYRIFRNFSAARTLLIREAALPALRHAEAYGFRFC